MKHGQDAYMATMTENLNLQRALIRTLDNLGGIDIIDNTKVSSIGKSTENGGWPLVHTSAGRTFRARLLVSPLMFHIFPSEYGVTPAGWC